MHSYSQVSEILTAIGLLANPGLYIVLTNLGKSAFNINLRRKDKYNNQDDNAKLL